MTKNKFIKALKIICALAPILYSFVVLTIAFFGSATAISGLTQSNSTDADNGLSLFTFDAYEIAISATITTPMNFIINTLQDSSIGLPIFEMYDWTTTNVLGISFSEIESVSDGFGIAVFPYYFIFLIFWYLIIELVFFIPEFIILFIRWCKNLMYSFTRKGGFDA